MIDNDSLTALIRRGLPDAQVEIVDRTGTMDHFNVTVRSRAFAGRRSSNSTSSSTARCAPLSKTAAFTRSNSTRSSAKARTTMSEQLKTEIAAEIAANKILVYGKGTKTAPRCGFTLETIEFFDHFGYPFEVVDVLENMPKREVLAEMTNWPTLPKVFIDGKFYGDTDILGPMAQNGELQTVLREAFGGEAADQDDDQPPLASWRSRRSSTRRRSRRISTIRSGSSSIAVMRWPTSRSAARLYDEAHIPGAFFADVEHDLAGPHTGEERPPSAARSRTRSPRSCAASA